jgi:protein SCO1
MLSVLRCLVLSVAGATAAHAAADVGPATAPRMEFTPLAAGTYRLPSIQSVADAPLLDEQGRSVHLSAFTHGKVTLLTFFYTYCADPLGCPFAHQTLSLLRDRIIKDRKLIGDVRFVGISCDPTGDTPAVLESFAGEFTSAPQFEWRFLTARSVPALLPVLDDFGQDVSIDLDSNGRPTRVLHHMLKVFLIDRQANVREIYSLAYIQPEVIFNDIRTLHLERHPRPVGVHMVVEQTHRRLPTQGP